jgi:hypothetical protein
MKTRAGDVAACGAQGREEGTGGFDPFGCRAAAGARRVPS